MHALGATAANRESMLKSTLLFFDGLLSPTQLTLDFIAEHCAPLCQVLSLWEFCPCLVMCHGWVRTKVHGYKFCVACSSVSSVIRDCSTDKTYEKERIVAYLRFSKNFSPSISVTYCNPVPPSQAKQALGLAASVESVVMALSSETIE